MPRCWPVTHGEEGAGPSWILCSSEETHKVEGSFLPLGIVLSFRDAWHGDGRLVTMRTGQSDRRKEPLLLSLSLGSDRPWHHPALELVATYSISSWVFCYVQLKTPSWLVPPSHVGC